MSFIADVRRRAAERPRKIVLPEGEEERTIQAARILLTLGLVEPVVLAAGAKGRSSDLDGIEVIDPLTDSRRPYLAELLQARRRKKNFTADEALERVSNPLLFAALLVSSGEVHGSLAGAVSTTGDVLRAGLWGVGKAPDISTVSSSFYMVFPPIAGEDERVLTFADGAVVPDPDSVQLAEIGIAAAAARSRVVGDRPRVAFLSYSTHGSASGPMVAKVREATALFRERAPEVLVDGELQLDAALVASIGARKAPGSPVAGQANVLIFPDLNSGNIGYKLVERLCGAQAVGPIVQGLAHPCNDLSRGASVEDIVNVACITSLMAD